MSPVPFSQLFSQLTPKGGTDAGTYSANITPDWLQGRAGFGGLLAALSVSALRREVGDERPLRALMTAFVGPAAVGEVDITTQTLRSGKSVTWTDARVFQRDQVCTSVSACFGGSRESSIDIPVADRPEAKSPEESLPFPYLSGLTPEFIQHFEMRWAFGGQPFSGSKESEMGVWVKFREEGPITESHLITFMDLLPPAVLQMQSDLKPISTLTWHLEILDDLTAEDARDGEGWWFVHVYARGAANGYSQQNATLYTPTGRALAMSQQSIAVFA